MSFTVIPRPACLYLGALSKFAGPGSILKSFLMILPSWKNSAVNVLPKPRSVIVRINGVSARGQGEYARIRSKYASGNSLNRSQGKGCSEDASYCSFTSIGLGSPLASIRSSTQPGSTPALAAGDSG